MPASDLAFAVNSAVSKANGGIKITEQQVNIEMTQRSTRAVTPATPRRMSTAKAKGYLHGFTAPEQERLRHQARFLEHRIHDRLPFARAKEILEVGCGVGAQTEILLRHFANLRVTGIDASETQLDTARSYLDAQPVTTGRFDGVLGDAGRMPFDSGRFDGAFLCWLLEHVANPALVLAETRRVLRTGAPIVVNEVQNASFFLSPYSPGVLAYWSAYNDHQIDVGGDPFVGAKLGNLLLRTGYRDIVTEVRTIHLDNRAPGERAEFIGYWTDLLLSGAPGLLGAKKVSEALVEQMKSELQAVAHDPDAVYFYSFVQARAVVG